MSVDELAARRRAKADARVTADCLRTIAVLERQRIAIDHVAALIAASIRRHPSSGRPYDQEAEG